MRGFMDFETLEDVPERDSIINTFIADFLSNLDENEEQVRDSFSDENLPPWFYKFIISFLTNLEFDNEESKNHFYKILAHRKDISLEHRKIDIRIAALDYFMNVAHILKNPIFIEYGLFEKIYTYSKEDPKTRLYNPRFFKEFVQKEIIRADRYQQKFSVILLDLDNFKVINDTEGHLYGDEVLIRFSNLLKEQVRGEDIVSRFGGDEFAILLPQTGRIGARAIAERLRERIHKEFSADNIANPSAVITFSAGIATYPFDATDYTSLIDIADKALYRSKFLGKDTIYDRLEQDLHNKNRNGNEHRKHPRFRLKQNQLLKFMNTPQLVKISARIANISNGGVLLECHGTIAEDIKEQAFGFVMDKLGAQNVDNLELSGKVVRINQDESRIKFYIAIQFDAEISGETWELIEKLGEAIID
jgi:diguanylate cyclase (GGDEF)-like protein